MRWKEDIDEAEISFVSFINDIRREAEMWSEYREPCERLKYWIAAAGIGERQSLKVKVFEKQL